jgi:hypothetical protein
VLLWRRPDIEPTSLTHGDSALLSMPETQAMGLESFNAEIVRQIEQAIEKKKPEIPRSPAADLHVFINATSDDRAIAQKVQQIFARYGCTVMLPDSSGNARELREDLEEKIIWCDAMALVYGKAKPRWIDSQAMQYSKVKRRRTEPAKAFLICRAPPQPKRQHGVAMPELREIDYTIGGPDDPIKDIIAELRK